MTTHCFLLDEHVSLVVQARLEYADPDIQVYRIGDGIAPPKGTLDPDILVWLEAHGCMLITNNRASMPVHLHEHLAQGRHVPAILQLPKRMQINIVVDDILLICGASLPFEFQDQIVYLPLRR